MKKIFTFAAVLMIVLTLSVSAFAANGAFVSSPSKTLAPELIDAENASPDCEADIVITSYADRTSLDEHALDELAAAYSEIASVEDLGSLSESIATLAENLGVSSEGFAVSELFDISYVDCDGHQSHEEFTITFKPASVENLVAVLHYTDSEWEIVPSKVENGEVTIVTKLFSPFALLVHTDMPTEQPTAGALPWIIGGIVLLLIILAIILILLSRKKKKAEQATDK